MYKNILIATDGSELATQGLEHGLNLAKSLNLPVTVVTTTKSWSPATMADDMAHNISNPIEQYEQIASEEAKKILASAKENADQLGVPCNCVHVADQYPAEGIIETATTTGCDLIVMASHGRRGLKKVLLGSVANEVLGNSKVPVLIVR